MENIIFKKDDEVFDIRCGWGIVADVDKSDFEFPVRVLFDSQDQTEYYTGDGKIFIEDEMPLLSLTEYTLEGFSQKRPINYKDYIGKWGKFWNNADKEVTIGKLERVTKESVPQFQTTSSIALYRNFQPLTEEQIRILDLE